MLRRLLVTGCAAAAMTAVVVPTAAAAPVRQVCVMNGEAAYPSGLRVAPASISYGLLGRFQLCHGNADVTRGFFFAGGWGTGSCLQDTAAGEGEVRWDTRQLSTFSFTVTRTGLVIRFVARFTSGRFTGLSAKAVLAFIVESPARCLKPRGLTIAGFSGPATIGL